jgi:16S rRNA (guanine527-N7)-methyltransferase
MTPAPTTQAPAAAAALDLLRRRASALGIVLTADAERRLIDLLEGIAAQPQNLTGVRDVIAGVDRHLADSLAGAALPAIAAADSLVDVGSGAGFPGLALAAARPELSVTLLESEGRKAEWLRAASGGFPNVRVVADRSETLAAREPGAHDVAVARALATLPVALELAAPLVRVGGAVVIWRGPRDADAEVAADLAAALLGLAPAEPVPVEPFPGAIRHLHVFEKVDATPARFPRRPGRAAKRPLGTAA